MINTFRYLEEASLVSLVDKHKRLLSKYQLCQIEDALLQKRKQAVQSKLSTFTKVRTFKNWKDAFVSIGKI